MISFSKFFGELVVVYICITPNVLKTRLDQLVWPVEASTRAWSGLVHYGSPEISWTNIEPIQPAVQPLNWWACPASSWASLFYEKQLMAQTQYLLIYSPRPTPFHQAYACAASNEWVIYGCCWLPTFSMWEVTFGFFKVKCNEVGQWDLNLVPC